MFSPYSLAGSFVLRKPLILGCDSVLRKVYQKIGLRVPSSSQFHLVTLLREQ